MWEREKQKEWKRPTKWDQVRVGEKVIVQFPHPNALIDGSGKLLWKEAIVIGSRQTGTVVKLPSGGIMSVLNLKALRVYV